MTYLVDSNVIIDVVTGDARFAGWSSAALAKAADGGVLCVNPIIFAEISIGFERIEDARATRFDTGATSRSSSFRQQSQNSNVQPWFANSRLTQSIALCPKMGLCFQACESSP